MGCQLKCWPDRTSLYNVSVRDVKLYAAWCLKGISYFSSVCISAVLRYCLEDLLRYSVYVTLCFYLFNVVYEEY